MRSPGAPLLRPTPTPEGGGGRNKARAPRRVPGAAEPEPGRVGGRVGVPGRGRPGCRRREAAGLPLPSPVPTAAAARIPAPGWSFPRPKFTLSGGVPRSSTPRQIRQLGVTAGLQSCPVPSPHASGSAQASGLRAASQHRAGRAGRRPRAPACPLPFATFPQPAAVGRRGPWAEPGRSARPASGGG